MKYTPCIKIMSVEVLVIVIVVFKIYPSIYY